MKFTSFKQGDIFLLTFSAIIATFPIFSLTIRGWVSAILFISSALALVIFWRHAYFKNDAKILIDESKIGLSHLNSYVYVLCFIFFLPLLSVGLSQLLNGAWNVSRLDGPSRYIFSLAIFFVLLKFKNTVSTLFEFSFPFASLTTFFLIPFLPKTGWATMDGRLTVYFIDPLIFGQLCLVFGILSLFSINLNGPRPWWINGFKLLGGGVGIYLSLMSQSRTGWLGVPIIFLFWLFTRMKGGRLKSLIIALVAAMILSTSAYQSSGIIKDRIDSLTSEILNYHWNSMNEYSSVGARISWIRIGFHYFSLKPISGWGDASLESRINDPEVVIYANQATRDELMRVGFHNDYIANMVHYGILGLVSILLIFLVPLSFFSYCYYRQIGFRYASFGIAYVLIQAVSSLSYHILDFKFMASFYALMVVVITGNIFCQGKQKINN